MRKCKFCFSKSEEGLEYCPVCGIPFYKTKKDLEPEEIKIWHAARDLHIVGVLMFLGALFLVRLAIVSLPFGVFLFLPSAVFLLFLGLFIRQYKKWAYIGSIIYFSIMIALNLFFRQIPSVLVFLLFLIVIMNPSAKRLFFREENQEREGAQ